MVGTLGIAAITAASYAIATSINSEDASGLQYSKSKMVRNEFPGYGSDQFLTDFDLKRRFGRIENAKPQRNGQTKARRRSSNFQPGIVRTRVTINRKFL